MHSTPLSLHFRSNRRLGPGNGDRRRPVPEPGAGCPSAGGRGYNTRQQAKALFVGICALAAILFQSGCEAPDMLEPASRPAHGRLTADYARQRSQRISGVEYDLQLSLDALSDEFPGRLEMRFVLSDPGAPVTVDFTDGSIDEVRVNGQRVPVQYNGAHITLPQDHLRSGGNEVHMVFRHPYSRSGQGLHRFIDPEDGRAYLHSHFEPYDANRLFPCFDQPDLKATYTLEVEAPAPWVVVSAARESEVISLGDRNIWRFEEMGPISTYIFPLHAGDYRVWESDSDGIPLRLFARHTLAEYVVPEDWFDLTRKGFAYFQEWFDFPYPYGKYDQLIVPEFNIGGMENVAAVTYNEKLIRRGQYTREEMERLANVLLHEMSHMWFGDLVTPQWWDGLWLKEAFATYMAFLAQAEATEYRDAWHMFYSDSKQRAYVADQLVTTHPIEVPVDDTHYAFANFDRITYQKGASVLTQLSHYVGHDTFRDGVRNYLKRHAGGATTLEDFIGELEGAAGRDLTHWVRDWLNQPGVNTLRAVWSCEDGYISKFTVEQSAPVEHPVLRRHRVQLGVYRWNRDQNAFETTVVPVLVSDERTEAEAVHGLPCPTLVYPNHGDWGFVRIELDDETLAALPDRIQDIGDPLLRSMFWQSRWDMMRDAKLSIAELGNLIVREIPGERSEKVLRQVAGHLAGTMDLLWKLEDADSDVRSDLGNRLEDLAWDMLRRAEPASDFRMLWLDAYRRVAHTPEALGRLASWLGPRGAAGVAPDQDRRWQIVARLSSFGGDGMRDLIAAESARDDSDAGHRMAVTAEATLPVESSKRYWLDKVRDPDNGLSLARRRAAIAGLFPAHQRELQAQFANDIIESLGPVGERNEDAFLSSYGTLIPVLCRADSVERLAGAVEDGERINPILYKALRIARQEDARCLAINDRLRQALATGR
jgi:aminopeptidase N